MNCFFLDLCALAGPKASTSSLMQFLSASVIVDIEKHKNHKNIKISAISTFRSYWIFGEGESFLKKLSYHTFENKENEGFKFFSQQKK